MGKISIESTATPVAQPPAGYKGSSGTFDGVSGYKRRTSSPNAQPEKITDSISEHGISIESQATPLKK